MAAYRTNKDLAADAVTAQQTWLNGGDSYIVVTNPAAGTNPKTSGYYEKSGSGYVKTTDTTVKTTKTYYIKQGAKLISPSDWKTTKDNMVLWLKQNVGSSLDGTTQSLQDAVIKAASSARGVAVGYLQKTFDHLYKITNDPTWNTTVGGPTADDADSSDTNHAKNRANDPQVNTQDSQSSP